VPPLGCAAGFMASGPVRNREDQLVESRTMSLPGRPSPAGSNIQTRTHMMALLQAPWICPPVWRLVFGTPAALASTGVLQLWLVNVAGFMDFGAALNREDRVGE